MLTATSDVSRNIVLGPPFRKTDVDTNCSVFWCIAIALNWSKDIWSFLLQYKLVGKGQELCSSLSLQDSLQYELAKATRLHAYELVPETYSHILF